MTLAVLQRSGYTAASCRLGNWLVLIVNSLLFTLCFGDHPLPFLLLV